jgi:hypothetical protein
MRTLYLILYIIAAVLFIAAAATQYRPTTGGPAVARINLLALGLLAWVLVPLIQTADRLND